MLLVDMVFMTKELGLRGVADVAFCFLFYVSPPHFFLPWPFLTYYRTPYREGLALMDHACGTALSCHWFEA